MSECTDTNETLSLCLHGIPVKFLCEKCTIDSMILNLDHKIEHCYKGVEKCFERLNGIEKSFQEKFDFIKIKWLELEDSLKNESIMRKDLRDYCFDRLGSAINPCSKNIDVYSRIEELELLTNALRDKYNSMCPPSLKKELYNCPVCDGDGRIKLEEPLCKDNVIYYLISCHLCQGKGVIWG
jgi:hypothetical protein